jgi:hypothetical protein
VISTGDVENFRRIKNIPSSVQIFGPFPDLEKGTEKKKPVLLILGIFETAFS